MYRLLFEHRELEVGLCGYELFVMTHLKMFLQLLIDQILL